MMTNPKNLAGIAAVLFASTIWGGSFVLAKLAMDALPVAHVVLYRFLFASGLMLPFLLRSRVRLERRDLPLFALTGFLMVPVTIILQFGGLALTSATSTALMVGVGTPLLAVAGVLFEKEQLDRRGWAAVAMSSAGVALLVGLPGEGNDWLGNLLVLASIVVSVVWILTSKRLILRYPAFYATGWIIVFGTLFLIPIVLAWSGPPSLALSGTTWASLISLGVGCTVVAYALWNWGVSQIGASTAGIYLNLEPLTGAFLGILVLDDPLTTGLVVGGTLILTSAGLVSSTPHREGSNEVETPAPSPTGRLVAECGPGSEA
ncbi:MAG: EamA family transporter [bacterium]|nr:EamA family transporter [bacterium]